MNTGDHVWVAPIGGTPENIKNHKMLQGVTVPRYTGRAGRTGIMLTKTLMFAGERGPLDTVNGETISWFRSYDKATGTIVSEMQIPANVTNVPMTYMSGGKQYIVIAVAAVNKPAELIALGSKFRVRSGSAFQPVSSSAVESGPAVPGLVPGSTKTRPEPGTQNVNQWNLEPGTRTWNPEPSGPIIP